MRYLLLIFTLILTILHGFSVAQSASPEPADWQRFQPQADEFFIDSPVRLKSDGPGDMKASRKFYGSINGVYLYVFSDPLKSPNNFASIRLYLKNWGQSIAVENADVVPKSLSFLDIYGFWQNIVLVRSETRVYIAQTVSRNQDDEVASRFIKSFGLGERRFFALEKGDIPKETQVRPTTSSPSSKGGGLGIGSGSRAGTGTAPQTGGIGTGTPSPTPKTITDTPLRILTKPRPAYTAPARFYEISGTIRVHVTFLASGEIGAVTPATHLPFGLSEEAIDAAKRIRFEPMYRDGVPISVVKQVEYSFLIY